MTASDTTPALHLEAPGPGPWTQDGVHFPRPMTRYFQDMHPAAFKAGTNEFARFYGMLIDGLQIAYVQGFGYNQLVPAPEGEVPERFQRAEQVYAQKLWREQLREWDEQRKPAAIAAHRAIQAIDPDALSDAELTAHLRRCRDHHAAMITQHMRFTAGAVLPTGDFLAHVGDWTGLPHSELLGLMRGAAEVSSGGSDEMSRLKQAFAQDAAARELLGGRWRPGPGAASACARSAARPARRCPATSTWSATAWSTASTSPSPRRWKCRTRCCVPCASRCRARRRSRRTSRPARPKSAPRCRRTPGAVRRVAGEARLTYRLRDERGVYSDIWASGLMRRAALAAGRRVAGARPHRHAGAHAGRQPRRDVRAGQPARGGPPADELAARAAYRATYTAKDVPPMLGPPAPPPPDLSALPPSVGRLMRATAIALGHLFGSSEAQHEDKLLYGLAASKGVYEGPARRVSGPSEFGRIDQGRRARHRIDDRGLQHPAAAAGRHRHRQRRAAVACGDRGARVRHPRRGRHARRPPSASATACACASMAMPAR